MPSNPRISIMPGRSVSGFHQPGRHRVHQARSAVRCSASRMKVRFGGREGIGRGKGCGVGLLAAEG